MLYPELFKQLESVRWDMDKDIPWDRFDASLLTDEQAQTIKMNAITEWAALPATEMFLRDNRDDSDFSAFMSIWFFEEQKHSLVLMEYLRRFRPELVPTEEELHQIRFEFDPAPALETLMLHFCGEIRLNHWYRRASEWHTEPVIKHIYTTLSQDEARHGGAYLRYMKRAIGKFGDEAKAAFAKVGVLMASNPIVKGSDKTTIYALTGATGQLGSLVMQDLLNRVASEALVGAGLQEEFADVLANASAASGDDGLLDDGMALSRLIDRATTPIAASMASALS